LNRLTIAAYQAGLAGDETFNYDLLGNRDSVVDTRSGGGTCNYGANNAVNEYTTVCGTAVSYDNAGNLTADHRGYAYHYDYENRLVEIRKTNDTISVATFEYDALGRRIEKVDAIAGCAM
jgi:YD repeat-containing protein